MTPNYTKRLVVSALVVVVLVGIYFLVKPSSAPIAPEPTPSVEPQTLGPKKTIIGKSVQGRNIEAYTFLPIKLNASATGDLVNQATNDQKAAEERRQRRLIFVGGIHGGYEWNSVLLAYQFMDYLTANPGIMPTNVTVTVIPSANPDGVYTVVRKEGRFTIDDISTSTKTLADGRFNANKVDLNRNFDCKWQPKSTWQSKVVSGGTFAFSEPETKAIRDYISNYHPTAVIFWHSKSNAVYASQCENGILPGTLDLMNTYSKASGYPAVKTFDAYSTTGAADDWLASLNIPAITVELQSHDSVEWDRNLAGVKALFGYFGRR